VSRKTTTVAAKSRARKSPRRRVVAEPAAKDRSQPQFAPIRTKRVFEEICEQVRREMAAGSLRPGDKLPPERELATKLGVSRAAVREALRSLEIAGVVGLQKGARGGAFILKGDPDLTGLIAFDRKRWAEPLRVGEVWSSISEMRAHRFDLVIDLQALLRSALVAWIANGKFTVGLQDWRELALGFYDRSVPRPSPQTQRRSEDTTA